MVLKVQVTEVNLEEYSANNYTSDRVVSLQAMEKINEEGIGYLGSQTGHQ